MLVAFVYFSLCFLFIFSDVIEVRVVDAEIGELAEDATREEQVEYLGKLLRQPPNAAVRLLYTLKPNVQLFITVTIAILSLQIRYVIGFKLMGMLKEFGTGMGRDSYKDEEVCTEIGGLKRFMGRLFTVERTYKKTLERVGGVGFTLGEFMGYLKETDLDSEDEKIPHIKLFYYSFYILKYAFISTLSLLIVSWIIMIQLIGSYAPSIFDLFGWGYNVVVIALGVAFLIVVLKFKYTLIDCYVKRHVQEYSHSLFTISIDLGYWYKADVSGIE
jgi:hypothetical protein